MIFSNNYVDFSDKFIKTIVYPKVPVAFFCLDDRLLYSCRLARGRCNLYKQKATFDYINELVFFEDIL